MVRLRRNTATVTTESIGIPLSDSSSNNAPGSPVGSTHHSRMFAPMRWRTATSAAVVLAIIAFVNWMLFTTRGQTSVQTLRSSAHKSQLHFLIPASSSNENLCQLLLSSIVLNYPIPVLMNWNALESNDAFVMHLAKIDSVLNYLKTFPPEQDDDLVLLVDGYDVWLQLPSEIIIRRYFDVVKKQNERIASQYGEDVAKAHDLRSAVFFGPDKACWPATDENGLHRPACWAVPQSTLPKYSFGPYEDESFLDAAKNPYLARPRWLNSGTVIGPVSELRAVYEATSRQVREKHVTDSDQYYFAHIWGLQELARMKLDPNATYPDVEKLSNPEIEQGRRTEYHISLDYDSAMFQTIGFYDPSVIWLRYDGSIQAGRPQDSPIRKLDQFELDKDIASSQPPLEVMDLPAEEDSDALNSALFKFAKNIRLKQWPDLLLATNVATKHIAPMMHFMMEKDYRVKWWKNMWFVPFARDLIRASAKVNKAPLSKTPIDGRMWYNAEGPFFKYPQEDAHGRRDGAWSDRGAWNSWDSLCQQHMDLLLGPAA